MGNSGLIGLGLGLGLCRLRLWVRPRLKLRLRLGGAVVGSVLVATPVHGTFTELYA